MKRTLVLLVGFLASGCGSDDPPHAVVTPVTQGGGLDYGVRYSPDATRMAFWRFGEDSWQLWTADADMGNARVLPVKTVNGNGPIHWMPDGTRLVVSGSMKSIADLVMVDVTTDSVTFLTETPTFKLPIQIHPDGDRVVFVAFVAGGTVSSFTVSVATREVAPLLPDVDVPAFGYVSPDGAHIGYTTLEGGASTVWISEVNGGARRQLTVDGFETVAGFPGGDAWSPDGTQFFYVSRRSGKPDIWVAGIDGTTRQLTTDINSDDNPAWSPDGRWVAFTSDRGRQGDVWVVSAAGGNAIRVTDDDAEEQDLHWVDASTLAFSTARSPATLVRRALADTAEMRLLPDSIDAGAMWESPDRNRLAFLIDHPGGSNDLAVMRMDGSDLQVISRAGSHADVLWNATSDRLAWGSDQSGSFDVYVAPVDGSEPARRLADWPGSEAPAHWSTDGQSVVVQADRETQLGDLWRIPVGAGEPQRISRIGSVSQAIGYRQDGAMHTVVFIPDQATGEIVMAELLPGDSLRTILRGNPSSPDMQINGLIVAMVPVEGRAIIRVLRPDGTEVRTVDPAVAVAGFSMDDRRLLYGIADNGVADLSMIDLVSGEVTRVTDTPDEETHAAFTAGGDSLVIRRVQLTRVLNRANVSALLRTP